MTDDPRIECKTCGDWGEVDVPSPFGDMTVMCPEQCAAFRLLTTAQIQGPAAGWAPARSAVEGTTAA